MPRGVASAPGSQKRRLGRELTPGESGGSRSVVGCAASVGSPLLASPAGAVWSRDLGARSRSSGRCGIGAGLGSPLLSVRRVPLVSRGLGAHSRSVRRVPLASRSLGACSRSSGRSRVVVARLQPEQSKGWCECGHIERARVARAASRAVGQLCRSAQTRVVPRTLEWPRTASNRPTDPTSSPQPNTPRLVAGVPPHVSAVACQARRCVARG